MAREIQPAYRCGAAIIITVVLLGASCGSTAAETPTGEAFDQIVARNTIATKIRPYKSIEELAAYTTYAASSAFSTTVVVGTISAVEPGIGFRWSENGLQRTDLPYGDAQAQVNSVHFIVDVTETLGPRENQQATQMRVGLAVSPNLSIDKIKADFLALDRVVLFLLKSPVFDYEPDLYGIIEDGGMMGSIDKNDIVTFPILEKGDYITPTEGIALDRIRAATRTT